MSNPGNITYIRHHSGRDFLTERVENTQANVWYYGASGNHLKTTSDPVWEIKRIHILPSGESEITYASGGGFVHIWDNRASYFSAPSAPSAPSSADDFQEVTIPKVQNVTIALANTEQSHTFPLNTKSFSIKARGTGKILLSFTATESGSVFHTIWPGSFYAEKNIGAPTTTIYFQSPVAGLVLELTSWS